MKIRPNCGNPISRMGTGALQTSSYPCFFCNALVSLDSAINFQPTALCLRPVRSSIHPGYRATYMWEMAKKPSQLDPNTGSWYRELEQDR
jgi:hypothetical protein